MPKPLLLIPEWKSRTYWIDVILLIILIPVISAASILSDLALQGMTIVWWPAAIPLSVYWFRGANRWLGVLLGYLLHYYVTYPVANFGLLEYAWILSLVNAVEALLIVWGLKIQKVNRPFHTLRDTKVFLFSGILPIGILTSLVANLIFQINGIELSIPGLYWWYAGNVVGALILLPFIFIFLGSRQQPFSRRFAWLWIGVVVLALLLGYVSFFPNPILPRESQCFSAVLFLPLYLITAILLGMIGVSTVLLIGGVISNLSYSQGIGICLAESSIPLHWLWVYMIITPLVFLLLAAYLDQRRRGGEV